MLKVLTALCEAPQKPESLPTFKIRCSSLPTVGNILCHTIANDDIQYRNPVTKKCEGDIFDFINAWMLLHDNPAADTTKPPGTPITAWGVKASPKGVGSCNFQPPEALCKPTVFISPVGNCDEFSPNTTDDEPLFHSVITPATTISDIHDDGVLIATLLAQLYGAKLLFTWPATTANRKFFRDYHGRDHFLVLGDAISKMDGLKLTFLNPGDGVKLDPGMIHAVISLTNSAIGCWEYVDAEWFDTEEIQQGTEWLLDLIKTRQQPLPNEVTMAELYKPIAYGMNMWRAVLKRLDDATDEVSKRRKQRIQEFIKWLQSEIPREYVGDEEHTKGETGGSCRRKKRRIQRGRRE